MIIGVKFLQNFHTILKNFSFFFLGVHTRCDPFSPIDLFEEKNIPKVINYLLGFESAAQKKGCKILLRRLDASLVTDDRFTEDQLLRAQETLKITKSDSLNILFHKPSAGTTEIMLNELEGI